METVFPFSMPPWQARPDVKIEEEEIVKATLLLSLDIREIVTNGSARNGKVGFGIFSKTAAHNSDLTVVRDSTKKTGAQNHLTAQHAESLDLFTSTWGQRENQGIREINTILR